MQKLRTLWTTFLAWLSAQFMQEPPTIEAEPPTEDEDPLYHTMDKTSNGEWPGV